MALLSADFLYQGLVIRTCKNVKLMDGSKTDVKVTVDLECKEYEAGDVDAPLGSLRTCQV